MSDPLPFPPHNLDRPPLPDRWPQHFRRPFVPFTAQVAIFFLVLIPLLVLRQFEKPRRRLSVWVCDLTRLLLGFASAELLFMMFVMPHSSIFGNPRGPPPPDWHGPLPPPPPPPIDSPTDPLVRHSRNGSGPRGPLRFQLRFRAGQTMSLTMSLLELFPGLFLIFGFYFILLQLFYRAKLYWHHKLRRPRLVHNNERGWVIERGLSDESDDVGHFYEDDPANVFVLPKERYSRARLGLVSGHYGHPVRVQYVAQQTACFTLSVFIVKAIIFKVCLAYPDQADKLRLFLFEWYLSIVDRQMAFHFFVVTILIPSLIYFTQFCLNDYVMRYRSTRTKGDTIVLPLYTRASDCARRNTSSRRQYNPHDSAFELQELRLPLLHTPPDESPPLLVAPTDTPAEPAATVSTRNSLDASPPASTPSNSRPGTPPAPSAQDINELSLLARRSAAASVRSSVDVMRVGLSQSYGIVTASLLNAAAVGATASARPFIFAPSSHRLDELDTDNEDSEDEDGDEDSEDGEAEVEEVRLPSYDDSQRQHRELLLNNPLRAITTNQIISRMKR